MQLNEMQQEMAAMRKKESLQLQLQLQVQLEVENDGLSGSRGRENGLQNSRQAWTSNDMERDGVRGSGSERVECADVVDRKKAITQFTEIQQMLQVRTSTKTDLLHAILTHPFILTLSQIPDPSVV